MNRKFMMVNNSIVQCVKSMQIRKGILFLIRNLSIWTKDSNIPNVCIRQLRKVALKGIPNRFILAKNVQSVSIRKVTLLGINLYIWAKSSNVQSVIIRQLGRVTLLLIINLYICAKYSNVLSVNIRPLGTLKFQVSVL
jgi:hypothetical protein